MTKERIAEFLTYSNHNTIRGEHGKKLIAEIEKLREVVRCCRDFFDGATPVRVGMKEICEEALK